MDGDNILSVKNLTVEFNGVAVLDNISFSIKKGEIFVIIGPNGAGKTVLFRALLGLIPYKGEIKWQENIRIGYVPQRLGVNRDFPLTVEEFLQLSPPKNNREDLYRVLKFVGFKGDEHHFEHHILGRRLGLLSSGELQRVLIAAAMLDKPDVLLFDEQKINERDLIVPHPKILEREFVLAPLREIAPQIVNKLLNEDNQRN